MQFNASAELFKMEKSSPLFNLGADELYNERVRFFTEFLDDDVFS
jgi:hypothetical protein